MRFNLDPPRANHMSVICAREKTGQRMSLLAGLLEDSSTENAPARDLRLVPEVDQQIPRFRDRQCSSNLQDSRGHLRLAGVFLDLLYAGPSDCGSTRERGLWNPTRAPPPLRAAHDSAEDSPVDTGCL